MFTVQKLAFQESNRQKGTHHMVLYISDRNSARGIRFRASSEELAARVHKQSLVPWGKDVRDG